MISIELFNARATTNRSNTSNILKQQNIQQNNQQQRERQHRPTKKEAARQRPARSISNRIGPFRRRAEARPQPSVVVDSLPALAPATGRSIRSMATPLMATPAESRPGKLARRNPARSVSSWATSAIRMAKVPRVRPIRPPVSAGSGAISLRRSSLFPKITTSRRSRRSS